MAIPTPSPRAEDRNGAVKAASRGRAVPPWPPAAVDGPSSWERFHALPAVRRRLIEFIGGPPLASATARFLAPPVPKIAAPLRCWPSTELWAVLAGDRELARSLWDGAALVVDLDLEHVHFDRPWQPLAEPARSLAVQRPVVAALTGQLDEAQVPYLHLLSGRGHHLLWRVARGSRSFAALARLGGPLSAELRRAYTARQRPAGERVGRRLGAAWNGLGKLAEWLAQRALDRTTGATPIPVELTAVIVGPGERGREIVSIDLSAFADPLHRRSVRMPFTAYRKALGGDAPLSEPLMTVPVAGDEAGTAGAMREFRSAAALARRTRCAIPDGSEGTARLIAAYERSELAAFHRAFAAEQPHGPERWSETYDRLALDELPACVAHILAEPNELLLRPTAIQLVVRALLARGWQARHVAGLIRSKYERPHGWLVDFHFHDAGLRAEFYTRMFAGLVATGCDRLIDFNCTSTQEKGLCPGGGCRWNLERLRDALAREEHDG
jgi:hypothetical protein